eukprot:CAMPEP_0179005828 /NCGR_PEP_ID=MMETSP0795-20121207/14187_1 /TAXON_ID=88552 /ORGANISM="Amoebophrya sp., Strain Ameob2" /LENGTH=480 /DNA_ID=CAMNT_0020700465 /DNA_START=511 /DNA_END=1954 /DNA_ORIENTATION=-
MPRTSSAYPSCISPRATAAARTRLRRAPRVAIASRAAASLSLYWPLLGDSSKTSVTAQPLVVPECNATAVTSGTGDGGQQSAEAEKNGANTGTKSGAATGLIVVDVQQCFTDSGEVGSGLQHPKGDAAYKESVVAFVKAFRAANPDGPIVLLQDSHPEDHVSFVDPAKGRGTRPYDYAQAPELASFTWCQEALDFNRQGFYEQSEAQEAPGSLAALKQLWGHPTYFEDGKCTSSGVQFTQPLFPKHCVQGTSEVQFIPGLCEAAGGVTAGDTCDSTPAGPKLKIVRKGVYPGIDSFGGIFDNRLVKIEPTTRAKMVEEQKAPYAGTGAAEFMVKNNAKHVVVFGIADDFCVKDTSIGLNDIEVLGLKQTFSKITYLHDISYGIVREILEGTGTTRACGGVRGRRRGGLRLGKSATGPPGGVLHGKRRRTPERAVKPLDHSNRSSYDVKLCILALRSSTESQTSTCYVMLSFTIEQQDEDR